MSRFFAYLWYIARHRYWVFRAACRLGIPWRGLVHDLSKYSRIEWGPYSRQFFNADGSRRQVRNPDGSYNPNAQAEEFRRAWLNHQRNPHHWQAWVSIGDGGHLSPLWIPPIYCREMVADWMGAGMAIAGRSDPRPWYEANKAKMVLHAGSRALIEDILKEKAVTEWRPVREGRARPANFLKRIIRR